MPALRPWMRDHFEQPRNVGPLAGATARGEGRNPACGDLLELELRIDPGRAGTVLEARFRAQSCSAVIACASLATERLRGLALEAAASLDLAAAVEEAGGLPPRSSHALAVVTRALHGALADHESRCHP